MITRCWPLVRVVITRCWHLVRVVVTRCWPLVRVVIIRCWPLVCVVITRCWPLVRVVITRCWPLASAVCTHRCLRSWMSCQTTGIASHRPTWRALPTSYTSSILSSSVTLSSRSVGGGVRWGCRGGGIHGPSAFISHCHDRCLRTTVTWFPLLFAVGMTDCNKFCSSCDEQLLIGEASNNLHYVQYIIFHVAL